MDWFLTFSYLFFLGSCFGWVLELFFRRFISAKKWLNPGFLVGPYLPLYGFGLCLLYLLAGIDFSFVSNSLLREIFRVLMMGLAMTAIEYLAGKIFILGMKVKLWDYSKKRGNIEGIICPEFSLYWTLLSALYAHAVHPFFSNAVSWLFRNLAFSFVIGFFFGVFFIDFAWSVRLLARIRAFAKENDIVVRLEELKDTIAERAEHHRFVRFLFSLKEKSPTVETLRAYREKLLEKAEAIVSSVSNRSHRK